MATRRAPQHEHDDDLHDRGLQFDVATLMQRRHALKLLFGGAAVALVGCGGDDKNDAAATVASTATTGATVAGNTSAGSGSAVATLAATATALVSPIPTGVTPASGCTTSIPSETAGPFPGDGSNGPNALAQSGIVRSDIRSSFGSSTNVAKGIPLTIALTIVDTKNGCKPLANAAVYLWHCDMTGGYSMYSQGVTNENYCRGVQVTDANGVVKYTTIFPAAYSGRWPHAHFEIYPSLDKATSSANKLATSQLALPEDVCNAVYATPGYEASVRNMAQTPLARDNVFSDGWTLQMATTTGNVNSGYVATLLVGV